MTKHQTTRPGGSDDAAFITLDGIARRHCCSVETVKRTARREGWTPYRMGGRIVRHLLKEVVAYEQRCANRPPSYAITPPKRHSNPATA